MVDQTQERKQLLKRIEGLLDSKDSAVLKKVLADARSSDVAEVVEVLDEIARQALFDLLDTKEAGEVLEKIDEATRSEVVEEMPSEQLTDIVATLPPDEAADVMADVSDISEEKSEEVLEQIDSAESDQIEKLMSYRDDTAGGIMNSDLVRVRIDQTIREATDEFRQADPDEDNYHVFVVDDQGRYKGTVGMRELVLYPRSISIREVLSEDIPAIEVQADQEEIANTFRKNDLIAAPVVDENHMLLGRITVDDIVDVMEEEAEEDALVTAGTRPEELDTHSSFKAATVRLPWLLTCMLGALLSTIIFYPLYEPLFVKFGVAVWSYVVIFIPAIAAMGGNSGMQTATVVVRGLATGDLAALDISQVFIRESRVAFIVALACGLIAGLVALTFLNIYADTSPGDPLAVVLGISVGVSMFFAIMLSTMLGLFLPYIFRNIGIDPAISCGPLVTTTNDIVSFVTYFSFALLLLKVFGN